jgi:thioredoxin 1
MELEQINKDNFEAKIAEGIVVVDVFASWCGPCKMLMPTLAKLSEEMTIYKISMEDEDDRAYVKSTYSVSSIPTLIFFKDGVEAHRTTGVQSEQQIREIIAGL